MHFAGQMSGSPHNLYFLCLYALARGTKLACPDGPNLTEPALRPRRMELQQKVPLNFTGPFTGDTSQCSMHDEFNPAQTYLRLVSTLMDVLVQYKINGTGLSQVDFCMLANHHRLQLFNISYHK